VEADDFGKPTFVEVAADGVPDFVVEVVSASVNIDSPRARAVKPPSGASSTRKITSDGPPLPSAAFIVSLA